MKIAFIVEGNPQDKRLWSGTVTSMYNALKSEHEVECIDVTLNSKLSHFISRVKSKLVKLFTGKKYIQSFTVASAKKKSKIVTNKLKGSDVDYVFCPAKSDAIAFCKTDRKIIYLTDALFPQMLGYYDYLNNLSASTIKGGNEIERLAVKKAHKVILASEWAKDFVVKTYGVSEEKAVVIPFASNFEDTKATPKHLIDKQLNLLFCGVEWRRKGGDVALKALEALTTMGYDAKLYLVGCNPPIEISNPNVIKVGFLNKNDSSQLARLVDIYKNSHFLILPTIAEAAGIVFAEASMNGIVSVTYDTGGVGSYVINGENGFRLPLGSTGEDFAKAISNLIDDGEKYYSMSVRARELYEERYNISAWLNSFNSLI
ncbi:MAG: glycosyltransferase family 4 protein [Clostridia bacterium]|nr:glycosyltransferase family 4 protein [Clostridia bacterium]